ncbi:hypothetical protein PVAP13_8NG250300 [Panicum virgatum]|uniref:Uncharacterized protein n=1 Tax=Panicum virgatum TaxID=38727 RepID=A0A8T0P9U7_PANVG|nr:hypothetical protein PVAP13_8NG250300 [Panicum virgatum]
MKKCIGLKALPNSRMLLSKQGRPWRISNEVKNA